MVVCLALVGNQIKIFTILRGSMDGFEIFSEIAFGTTFDPKQKKRRKNKFKNAKRNKKIRLEQLKKEEEQPCSSIQNSLSEESSSESNVSSDEEPSPQTPQKAEKKKEKKRLSTMQMFKIHREEVTHFRRKNKIYVTGDDVPDPIENFNQLADSFDTSPSVLTNITSLGYLTPTPIQMQAIPLMLHKRQLLACAPTGSGKTAAFLIPLIHNLKGPEKGGLRAVIIAPTRELVKQIYSFCLKLSESTNLRILIIEDVNKLKKKPIFMKKHDILITTPNRLIYFLQNDPPLISLKKVQWLIVDECDKLFEIGKEKASFRDQLAVIYNACDSSDLRRAMYSATFSHDVEEWCKLNLDSLVCVAIGNKNTAVDTIKQELLFVGSEGGKLLALRNLIQEGFMPPLLIFVQSKERAKELYSEIACYCVRVDVIHADLTQEKRDQVVQKFINGKVWILICTELMARGIDFKGVNLVLNYDLPPSSISYIHRIGRTGRAGEDGRAITYFSTDDVENLKSIAKVIKNAGCEVPDYIMSLKTTKKKKGEIIRPIKRQNISTVPTYDLEKQSKKRKLIKNSIKRKQRKETKSKS